MKKKKKKNIPERLPSIEDTELVNKLQDECNKVNEKTGSHFFVSMATAGPPIMICLDGIPDEISKGHYHSVRGNVMQISAILRLWIKMKTSKTYKSEIKVVNEEEGGENDGKDRPSECCD